MLGNWGDPGDSERLIGKSAKFEDKFEMIEELGKGVMGEIWLVKHKELNILRALKFILPRYAENDESRERLRREARAMARVAHPHAVRVHDVCMGDIPYIEIE